MSGSALAKRAVAIFALPLAITTVWYVATLNSTSFFMPPLKTILGVFPDTWFTAERITDDVLPSVGRLALGYGSAVLIGVSLGVAIGSYRRVRSFFEPVLEFLRAIPAPVLVPVIMLFAGIETKMKVIVIISGCVWPILLNTVEGVRNVDAVQRDVSRCYRIRAARRLLLTLRAASPQIFAGARVGLSVAIILMVISEMFAASNGLGFSIVQFQRSFAIPEMWSGIILLGFLGVAVAVLFRFVESRALRWYEGLRQAQKGR